LEPFKLDFVNLVENSVSVNAWNVYANAEKSFEKFRKNYDLEKIWPVPISHLASYVELHICGRILIISASISTVIGLLMSALLYVLDIPFNNLSVRPSINGSFFCHFNHEKVTRYQVTVILKSALILLGYKPGLDVFLHAK
jgi:energy-converting hydrogenase Eha subunit A